MIPYFGGIMLAKITAKNQLTLPKSLVQSVGATDYFDVQACDGQLILTPVRIQRGDAVRAKLADLGLTQEDIKDAVQWARASAVSAAEPSKAYVKPTTTLKKSASKKATPKA
ncbi:MAG: hypothetical protein RL307_1122 [Pseudomonadota bacterium]|jgi:hypothetical protein